MSAVHTAHGLPGVEPVSCGLLDTLSLSGRHPVVALCVYFDIRLDVARLTVALRRVRARHPLLCCRIERHPLDLTPHYWYRPDSTPSEQLMWVDNADPGDWEDRNLAHALSPYEGPPFRLHVLDGCCTTLQLIMAHSVVDGFSLLLMMRDLLRAYADPNNHAAVPLQLPDAAWEQTFACPVDADAVRRNYVFLCHLLNRQGAASGRLQSAPGQLLAFPRSVTHQGYEHTNALKPSRLRRRTLSPQHVAALQACAHGGRAGVFEVVAAILLEAQHDLMRRHGETAETLALSFPVNIRRFAQAPSVREGLGNYVLTLEFEQILAEPASAQDQAPRLERLAAEKFKALRNYQTVLQKSLVLHQARALIPAERLRTFYAAAPAPHTTHVRLSHLGSFEKFVGEEVCTALGVQAARFDGDSTRGIWLLLECRGACTLTFASGADAVDQQQADALWDAVQAGLNRLANSS